MSEVALLLSGEMGETPPLVKGLTFSSPDPYSHLMAVYSAWTSYEPWSMFSINNHYGMVVAGLYSPVQVAGFWSFVSFILVLCIPARGRWNRALAATVCFILPWLLMDFLWQADLASKVGITKDKFADKSPLEKQLAAEDASIFQFTEQLKESALPVEPARIFILRDSTEQDYDRLKVQYYLLPHNVYNYGSVPRGELVRSDDYILVLGSPRALSYDSVKRTLNWDNSHTLPVTLLQHSRYGALFQVDSPDS